VIWVLRSIASSSTYSGRWPVVRSWRLSQHWIWAVYTTCHTLCYRKYILIVCQKGINEFQMLSVRFKAVEIIKFCYVVACRWNKTSAKCNSVQNPHAILADTPGDLTSASKYFQTLPDPPGAEQSALRLCKSILRCSWKYRQLWSWIQNAPSGIVQFCSSWALCADLQETSWETEMAALLCRILQERP